MFLNDVLLINEMYSLKRRYILAPTPEMVGLGRGMAQCDLFKRGMKTQFRAAWFDSVRPKVSMDYGQWVTSFIDTNRETRWEGRGIFLTFVEGTP